MGWQRGFCSWPHVRAVTEIARHPDGSHPAPAHERRHTERD
jgi:hypothetical protein